MKTFVDRATDCLYYLSSLCEAYSHLDCEEGQDFLSIDLGDGRVYLFNIHKGMQQLWMSSPFSGGRHFEWHQPSHAPDCLYPWIDTRTKELLIESFKKEMRMIIAKD